MSFSQPNSSRWILKVLADEYRQFGTVKFPLKRRRALVGQLFVQGQPEEDRFQIGKVIRRQHLPLDDREVALDLIEPTGVDRGMDQDDAGIDLLQPCLCGFAAMRRAVVHNPGQTLPRAIRLLHQYVVHQPAKGLDAGGRFTPPHHVPPADVPGRQVLQRATAIIFELDTLVPGWCRTQAGVTTEAGLEARFLVGTENMVLGAQRLALLGARIQVKNRSGLLSKQRVPWKDPVLVPPWLDGIRLENPPHRAPTDRFAQGAADPGGHVGQGLPT